MPTLFLYMLYHLVISSIARNIYTCKYAERVYRYLRYVSLLNIMWMTLRVRYLGFKQLRHFLGAPFGFASFFAGK